MILNLYGKIIFSLNNILDLICERLLPFIGWSLVLAESDRYSLPIYTKLARRCLGIVLLPITVPLAICIILVGAGVYSEYYRLRTHPRVNIAPDDTYYT